MTSSPDLKTHIYAYLNNMLNERIKSDTKAIQQAKEARNSDTKSSAGDKYETGRAMMQMEIEKHDIQLNKAKLLRNDLLLSKPATTSATVQFGSLVYTNKNIYFLAIGLGKIEIENNAILCVSLVSPIGQALKEKAIGDKITFNGEEMHILEIK